MNHDDRQPPATSGGRTRYVRPTMVDVAVRAGVSLKTVSRVVNRESGVSPGMTAKVEAAIADLDYRPNISASSLRRSDGLTAAVGVVLEDLANPFSATLLRAIEDEALSRNVLVFGGSVDEDPERERELIRAFTMRRVDAIIIAPASREHRHLEPDMRDGTPFVFVDRPPVGLDVDVVLADNEVGAATAVRHLAAHGHERIAYLGDLSTIPTAERRCRGFREACADLGAPVEPRYVRENLRGVAEATEAVIDLFRQPSPPTAIFASQNLVTIGAIKALQAMGLEHRVALVGFDDFLTADLLHPAVTVVAQDAAEMGRAAAELAFRRLDGVTGGPISRVIETRLVVRGSGEIPPTPA